MALTRSQVYLPEDGPSDSAYINDGYGPVFGGVAEFGFGLWGNSRLSVHSSLFSLVEDEDVHTWIGIGLGFGGRF